MGEIIRSTEQLKAINTGGCNLLVSAAAGSGKTTVLVDRIIKKITEEDVDIDRILVLTFTNAAAAQMREKIERKITDLLSADPSDERLIKQSVLIHNAQITTIHSFCLFLMRNNFADIDLDPSFRVAEEGEIKLIEGRIADELIEDSLKEGGDFLLVADRFVQGSSTAGLKDVILKLYEECRNAPYIEEYIAERRRDYACDPSGDINSMPWVRYLLEQTRTVLDEAVKLTKSNLDQCMEPGGAYIYEDNLRSDMSAITAGTQCKTYEEFEDFFENLQYTRLSTKKAPDIDDEAKAVAKVHRDSVKKMLSGYKEKFYSKKTDDILSIMKKNDRIVNILMDTLEKYDERLREEKKQRKIIDFGDMEHYALKILTKKEEGRWVPTEAAVQYSEFYEEIMVDEYQDSNRTQEEILDAISGKINSKFNKFMVGDVKQSIYSFRRACPDIFMEKYRTYNDDKNVRVDLSANYRSRDEVVDTVNHVFERIMSSDLGMVDYDSSARLYRKAEYPETEGNRTELLLLNTNSPEYNRREQEAMMVASRIKRLISDRFEIYDKELKKMRPCSYHDMVILLRTNKDWDEDFKRVFELNGIPCYIASKKGYFASTEIRELLSLLSVLDNPRNDIALFGVLKSIFGGFDENELSVMHMNGRKLLYDNLKEVASFEGPAEQVTGEIIKKSQRFMELLNKWRAKKTYTPIHELITDITEESGYMYHILSLPFGEQRAANVRMLIEKARKYEQGSFKGLYHFVHYIEEIRSYEVDYGEAVMTDENSDVVRIMSIHKSKGLEYPICFVSGIAKGYNFMDTNSSFLVDRDMGIGLDLVENNIRIKDIRKLVLSEHMRREIIAEEMRILYVAMTRAEEKLIFTSAGDNIEADKDAIVEKTKLYGDKVLPYSFRLDATSYFKIIAGCLKNNTCIDTKVYELEELKGEDIRESVDKERRKRTILDEISRKTSENADAGVVERIGYRYPDKLASLYIKTSVSELKISAIEEKLANSELEDIPAEFFTEHEHEAYIPEFARSETGVKGTAVGSAYHRVMELFKFDECADLGLLDQISQRNRIDAVIENEISSGKIDRDIAELVDIEKILLFMRSDLGHRMCLAACRDQLHLEEPFVLSINADRLKPEFPSDENVLIQGIIDAFFVEDGEIVLMDYKTDRVKDEHELIERYKLQLDYYEEALRRITGFRVKEKLIYSFSLNKTISC